MIMKYYYYYYYQCLADWKSTQQGIRGVRLSPELA
jgi:hypothetical protein